MLSLLPRRAHGFTLIELMVAMALGLIVVGAVIALVLSIIRSNRQTLQSTRLNQELRATLSVVASDLRRARSVDDPLTSALLVTGNPYRAMRATADCIVYAYDGAVDGPWHIVRLDNDGHLLLEGSATDPPNCSPGGTATAIGSDQVEITNLTFTPTTTSSDPPLVTDEAFVREFTVTITGHLRDANADIAAITRTMSQTVYVRSVGTGI